MRLHDAGIDWLTMTWKNSDKNIKAVESIIELWQKNTSENPKDVKDWAWNGYRGTTVGDVAIGRRHDGVCVRASGHRAREIAKIIRGAGIGGKATRIDFQTTGKTSEDNASYLQRICEQVQAEVSGEESARARNTANYRARGRCCGMVIGSRSSENYLRIYDKSFEQSGKVEENLVRFEAELKGDRAKQAWKMYEKSAQPYYVACSVTMGEFQTLGVDMSWVQAKEQVEFVSSYRGTDKDRKLEWLRRFVQPTVTWLRKRGYTREVYTALGLDIAIH